MLWHISLQQRHALLFGPENFSSLRLLAKKGCRGGLYQDPHCNSAQSIASASPEEWPPPAWVPFLLPVPAIPLRAHIVSWAALASITCDHHRQKQGKPWWGKGEVFQRVILILILLTGEVWQPSKHSGSCINVILFLLPLENTDFVQALQADYTGFIA